MNLPRKTRGNPIIEIFSKSLNTDLNPSRFRLEAYYIILIKKSYY